MCKCFKTAYKCDLFYYNIIYLHMKKIINILININKYDYHI